MRDLIHDQERGLYHITVEMLDSVQGGAGLHRSRSADQAVIVGMRADPEPKIYVIRFNGQSSITQADAH